MRDFNIYGFDTPPRKRTKTPDEILRDRVATLEAVRIGHEARIEHLEAVIAALCHTTGVHVPEPPGL